MKKHASEFLTATKQFVGDGEYWLMLRLVQAADLEISRGISISRTYGQLLGDLYEEGGKLKLFGHADIQPGALNAILRLALVGGNCGPDHGDGTEVGPKRADQLVSTYGYPERPVEEVAAIVFRVLHAAMVGDPAQREALPEEAAASDAAIARQNKAIGEALGPTMRARAEQADAG